MVGIKARGTVTRVVFGLTLLSCLGGSLIWAQRAIPEGGKITDPASLQIQVRTAQGELPPGTVLARLFLGDVLIQETLCDARGSFIFEYLDSGVYDVEVSLPGFKTTTEEVRIRPAQRRRVAIQLGDMEKRPFDPASNRYWRAASADVREQVGYAREMRTTGFPADALPYLDRALEMDPEFSIAHGEKGLCYMRMNQLEDAQASFEKAVEYGPESLTNYLNLAEVFRLQGNIKMGEETLVRVSEVYPDRAEPYYIRAKMQFDAGMLEPAVESAQLVLEKDHSTVPQVYLLLADIHRARGELYRVLPELESYLALNPEGEEADRIRGQLESTRAELKSMEISLKRYTDLVERYRGGSFNDAATALSQLPRDVTQKASRLYQKEHSSTEDSLSAALLHTDAALIPDSERSFHFRSAMEFLRRLEDEPRRRAAQRQWLLCLAYLFQKEQRYLVALPFLTHAAFLFPDDIEILLALGTSCESAGWIYGYENLIDRAEKVYRDILLIDPTHVEAHLRLGHILKVKGHHEQSAKELSWIAENTESPDVIVVAALVEGDIHRARGDLNRAIESYRAAVELDPSCQAAVTALSHAVHLSGDTVGSHQMLRRLLENDGSGTQERTDAWWRYLEGHSERGEAMLKQMRGTLKP
jgi:tetratricopeptide (TPR) repeat protein